MILNKTQILERIKSGMITKYIDLNTQIQPNGFDISVKEISLFMSTGTIDFDNTKRKLPLYLDLTSYLSYHLQHGSYLVEFNEKFNIPNDLIAIGYSRSSLLRMGAFIPSAIWDAGFNGYGQGMLIVNNNYGINIMKNARIMQLVFIEKKDDESVYEGKYNDLIDIAPIDHKPNAMKSIDDIMMNWHTEEAMKKT